MKFEAARIQFSGDVLAAVANEGLRGRGWGVERGQNKPRAQLFEGRLAITQG